MDDLGCTIVIGRLSVEDGGGDLAYVPDLPGCTSYGATRDEATRNAQDAIARWIEAARESGRDLPRPTPATPARQHA